MVQIYLEDSFVQIVHMWFNRLFYCLYIVHDILRDCSVRYLTTLMKEKQWVRYVSNVWRRREGGLSGQDNTLTPHAPPRYNTTAKKVPEEPDRYVNVVTRQLFFPSALSFSRFYLSLLRLSLFTFTAFSLCILNVLF
jgi:hypothetical protein